MKPIFMIYATLDHAVTNWQILEDVRTGVWSVFKNLKKSPEEVSIFVVYSSADTREDALEAAYNKIVEKYAVSQEAKSEIACEIADSFLRVVQPGAIDVEDEDDHFYTEDAQKVFDEFYDSIMNQIERKDIFDIIPLMVEKEVTGGSWTYNNKKLPGDCFIGFEYFFNGKYETGLIDGVYQSEHSLQNLRRYME